MFKNIGIYVKEKSGEIIDSQNLDDLILSLKKHNSNVYIEETSEYKNSALVSLKYNDFVSKIDLIIVFGGDGTLLRAARNYLEHNIPILGINMGTVGFLTDIKIEDFESVIKDILDGNCEIEERNLVCASFGNNSVYGLNEIVIHSGAYTQLMRYRLSVNEKIVYEQRSDGLIIATPTGSTAYALSAGGPIIHPGVDVWTILPMLPQSMSSRPFVISSDQIAKVNLLNGPLDEAKICADGQDDISVPYSKDITISKMKETLRLVHPKNNDFFEACREKLGWSLDISKK
ncbi:MAG: NAD(+)/NADH kinase [SAR86 cluster bacterium]|uniref:NAD kinase n=1 Tax=SAR86 cluster bacterium TaxID=2030880 RepID=A0A937IBH3_9GAMM|nr:NAD(+)/NADH kinase [SAR86 cluster bacterium]